VRWLSISLDTLIHCRSLLSCFNCFAYGFMLPAMRGFGSPFKKSVHFDFRISRQKKEASEKISYILVVSLAQLSRFSRISVQ
jgi:hypothetical protein